MCVGNLHFEGSVLPLDSSSGDEIGVAVQFADNEGSTYWTAIVQPETWLMIVGGADEEHGPSPEEWTEFTMDAVWMRGTFDEVLGFANRPEHPLHKVMHALENYQTNPPARLKDR